MTHAIGSTALLQTALDATDRAATTPKTSVATAASSVAVSQSSSSSSTSISGAASALSVSTSDSDVRTGKVEALKAAIASGSYNVPAEKVADKLIGSMLG